VRGGAAPGAGFGTRFDTLVSSVADGQVDPLRVVVVTGIAPLVNGRCPDSRSRFTRWRSARISAAVW
jgi:hypothetical protein